MNDNMTFVGPMLPATKRGLFGFDLVNSSHTLRASRAASTLISRVYSASPNSSIEMMFALNESVSMMSAPAARYCR